MSNKNNSKKNTSLDFLATEVMEKEIESLEWDLKYYQEKVFAAEMKLKVIKDALAKHLNS